MMILKTLAVEMVIVGAVLDGARTNEKRTEIVSITCVVLNTLMYASPLSIMVRHFLFLLAKYSSVCFAIYNATIYLSGQKTVIQTRSVKYMPVFVSLTSLVSTICWMIYSIYI